MVEPESLLRRNDLCCDQNEVTSALGLDRTIGLSTIAEVSDQCEKQPMRFWLNFIRTIKSEVGREGVAWYAGGYVRRQRLAFPLLVLGVLAVILTKDGTWQNVGAGIGVAGWFVWMGVTLAVGTFFVSSLEDKRRGRRH